MSIEKWTSTLRLARALELLCSGMVFSDYKKRPLGLILLLVMILMGFEVGTKKPLCITSKIVNKIDRITLADALSKSTSAESIYSCSAYRVPRFSTYFYENLGEINSRLSKMERVSALLGLNGRMDLEISEVTTGQIKLKNNKIAVSQDRFQDAEVEKLFVTVLLLQNMKFESAPFVNFLAGWLTDQASNDGAIEEIWNESFEKLTTFEQFSFKEAVYTELRKFPDFPYKSLSENMQALLKQESRPVQKFKSLFEEGLMNLGLSNSSTVADVIFENRSEASDFNPEELIALAKKNKSKRLIFEDSTGRYILPYMTKLEGHADISAQLRVVLSDERSQKLNVDSYLKNTEKLVLFKAKTQNQQLKFSGLFASKDLKKNEQSFLNANKGFDVVQFHVPSLKYTKASIGSVNEVFGLLKQSKSFAVQKKLGWESVVWSSEAQAFKPVAVYDVIQYYRIN